MQKITNATVANIAKYLRSNKEQGPFDVYYQGNLVDHYDGNKLYTPESFTGTAGPLLVDNFGGHEFEVMVWVEKHNAHIGWPVSPVAENVFAIVKRGEPCPLGSAIQIPAAQLWPAWYAEAEEVLGNVIAQRNNGKSKTKAASEPSGTRSPRQQAQDKVMQLQQDLTKLAASGKLDEAAELLKQLAEAKQSLDSMKSEADIAEAARRAEADARKAADQIRKDRDAKMGSQLFSEVKANAFAALNSARKAESEATEQLMGMDPSADNFDIGTFKALGASIKELKAATKAAEQATSTDALLVEYDLEYARRLAAAEEAAKQPDAPDAKVGEQPLVNIADVLPEPVAAPVVDEPVVVEVVAEMPAELPVSEAEPVVEPVAEPVVVEAIVEAAPESVADATVEIEIDSEVAATATVAQPTSSKRGRKVAA